MKLNAQNRSSLASSTFGLPAERKYPMPDKSHARVAKAYAARYATPAQKAEIDAKANQVLGTGTIHHKPGCGGNHTGSC